MTVYMIEYIGFDNMENYDPYFYEFKGYCNTEEEAIKKVADLDKKPKYKGWDGEFYPQYKIIPLKELK